MTIFAQRGLLCLLSLSMLLGPARLLAAPPDGRPHKVGLVLSGGGARGAAHIGVLKVLEREQIPIDCIAGTSFGSVVGALYALGYTPAEIEQIFTRQDWNSLFSDAAERRLSPLSEGRESRYQGQLNFQGLSFELPTGLWTGQKMIEVLNSLTVERMLAAQDDFDRLPIPFRAVATNLLTGEPYVFRSGRMTQALRASFAIPMLFTPVEKDGMLLVDGGLSDNLPSDVARDMGADIVLAVDVTAPLLQKGEIRSFLDVIDQSVSLLMKQSVERNRPLADLTITPELQDYTYRDYTHMSEIISRGEKEAERRVADLRSLVAGIPPRPQPAATAPPVSPVIESVSFEGLKKVDGGLLNRDIRSKPGKPVNSNTLRNDLGRLYATHLFSQVDCSLDPASKNKYQLVYHVKESAPNTLGTSIRYDRDDKFVALLEATVRQLFNSPSSLTLSSQFGGIEYDSIALRFVSRAIPFLFLEPQGHIQRRNRSDFRGADLVDTFTDKRSGGQLVLGGTLFKRIELEAGISADRVTTGGGSPPNMLSGPQHLVGPILQITRDTLDRPDFPATGSTFRLLAEKRVTGLGSDVSYSRLQIAAERYFSVSQVSTFLARGYFAGSSGDVPFYDRFYAGGFSYSEGGPQRFVGYDRDELAGNQMALLTLGYRRQLFARPFSFARRGFLSVQYNGSAISTQQSSPYDFSYLNGAAVGFSLDTLLGPMRAALALGEAGRVKFYLSLGPGF